MPTLMSSSSRAADSALAPADIGDLASRLRSLHDDPYRIHHLLDLLRLPPGTEVRVTTVAASVIVR
jgi:hypothetical protein